MIIYFITCGFKKHALEKQYFDLDLVDMDEHGVHYLHTEHLPP